MGRIIPYSILILFIVGIVCSSGCLVPTKPVTSGNNNLVPVTGSPSQQQSQNTAQNQGAPSLNPTQTPIPDDTRFLTRVPTFAVRSGSTPPPVKYRSSSSLPPSSLRTRIFTAMNYHCRVTPLPMPITLYIHHSSLILMFNPGLTAGQYGMKVHMGHMTPMAAVQTSM